MATESSLVITSKVIVIILIIISTLPTFLLSRLTKLEHDEFHDQWEKDGRPHGMPFWFPLNEMRSLGFSSNPWYLGTWWLFKTPDWVKEHTLAIKLLRYYRFVSYFIYIGLSGICLLMILLSPR